MAIDRSLDRGANVATMEATARPAGIEMRVFEEESACGGWLAGRSGPAVPAPA